MSRSGRSDGDLGWLSDYDVVWDQPSRSSAEAMPGGAGGVGLAVWCEAGDLLAYVDRSGSFDENNSQLKLGRLRVRLDPNPFADPDIFEQRLVLADGDVVLTGRAGGVSATVRFWAEIDRPVVHVDVEADREIGFGVAYEGWRVRERVLDAGERNACLSFQHTDPSRIRVVTHPDVVEHRERAVRWYHRNDPDDLLFDKLVTIERLDAVREHLWNPQRDVVFGGELAGPGLRRAETVTVFQPPRTHVASWWLRADRSRRSHRADLTLHHDRCADVADWQAGLDALIDDSDSDTDGATDSARTTTVAWWHRFWARSRLVVDPDRPGSPGWRVGRNYQLVRHLLAVGAGGDFPMKFNGGLFTVDAELTPQNDSLDRTPDFRAWGGGSATAQNQRLLNYPLLRSGDLDLLDPQLEFYARALGNAELRTETYWGHGGASFTEQMEDFGLPCLSIYDWTWDRHGVVPRPLGPGRRADPGFLDNDWCSDLYDTALEFALLALDQYAYRGDSPGARVQLGRWLPFVTSTVRFFDEHFRNADGALALTPTSAAETYKGATDAVTTVAGLRVVLDRLLTLPAELTASTDRHRWTELRRSLPPLPTRQRAGRTVLAPARTWERINNVELPQLYPVFPWGLYGVGRPDLQLARDTFEHGADGPDQHGVHGWRQDPIFAARLGLTSRAAAMVADKLADAPRRYPAFWGPNFDWIPDLNHGGSAAVALQEMLLQTDGDVIHLTPAWPADWDVEFRLHAPGATVVTGTIRDAVVTALEVDPPERARDVVVHPIATPDP